MNNKLNRGSDQFNLGGNHLASKPATGAPAMPSPYRKTNTCGGDVVVLVGAMALKWMIEEQWQVS